MVINLKNKEGNLSGKEFNWSLFGLLDDRKANKDAEIFKRIAEDMVEGANAGKVLAKEYLNLTDSGQRFAQELVHTKKPIAETRQGFLAAAQSAEKMSFASRAASVGMKALAVAGNMFIMLVVSQAINFAVQGINNLAYASEKCKERVDDLMSSLYNLRLSLVFSRFRSISSINIK